MVGCFLKSSKNHFESLSDTLTLKTEGCFFSIYLFFFYVVVEKIGKNENGRCSFKLTRSTAILDRFSRF